MRNRSERGCADILSSQRLHFCARQGLSPVLAWLSPVAMLLLFVFGGLSLVGTIGCVSQSPRLLGENLYPQALLHLLSPSPETDLFKQSPHVAPWLS